MTEKNVPVLRFSEFCDEWEKYKLKDLGHVESCRRIYESETSERFSIPFFKISTFGKKPDSYISRKKFEDYKKRYPYPNDGDILISASGTIGKTVKYKDEDAYYQDSNIVWLSIDKHNLLINNFLLYIYQKTNWIRVLEGSTIKRLYNKHLLNLKIFIPTIEEQEKIADFFSTLDQKIEIQEKAIASLQELKKGYMQKIFSQELRFKDENGEDFPAWITRSVDDIGTLKNGYNFNSKNYKETGKYNILTISNVTDERWVIGEMKKIDKLPNNIKDYQILKNKDILISMTGNVGRVSYNRGKNNLLNQRVGLLQTKDYICNKEFIFQVLSSSLFKHEMEAKGQGAAQMNISKSDIINFKIKLPCLKEQEKIADFLSTLDKKIELEKEILQNLKKLKKGFLQQMFV